MAQTNLQTSLENVHQKLKLLLDKHSALQKENIKLTSERNNLQKQLDAKDEQIKQLQQESDILKSGIQNWHPAQKKIFARRIDQYLKEIDKCIALINE